MEHGSKAPCSKPPARTKHAPPPSNSLVLRKQEFHVHRCGDWRQLCQRHSQPQGAKKNFAKNWICVSPAFERLPLAWKNKPQLGKTKKVFYCTGLHMGWKTFYCIGLHMAWKAFCPHRSTRGEFGSLSNYCFVPAMPMEPPTKKRKKQYQGWELHNSQDSQVPLEPEGGPPQETTLEEMRATKLTHRGTGCHL